MRKASAEVESRVLALKGKKCASCSGLRACWIFVQQNTHTRTHTIVQSIRVRDMMGCAVGVVLGVGIVGRAKERMRCKQDLVDKWRGRTENKNTQILLLSLCASGLLRRTSFPCSSAHIQGNDAAQTR